ncbi:MAG: HEAT repeat domain-containing protein [Acidobacteria bacterium]|nr:HEAT repeat domain-containing protein [Acidobacteriota bacterium]
MRTYWLILLSSCVWAATIEDARKALTDAAHSKEGDERRETALALSLVPAKDPAAALLEDMLKDKDYLVRVAALDTLGELNDKNRVGLLKSALSDDVPEVAFAAAKALYTMKDPAGLEALESVYEGEIKAKSGFFKKEMMNSWRRLKTPRSAFLFAVQRGVGFVPVPGIGAGYNALLGMLSDAEFSARAVSLLMVCGEKGKVCDKLLASSFADEDWTVRAAAVHIVATKQLVAMKPKLAELISDKKQKVRLRAAAAYLRMESSRPMRPPARRPALKG